MEELKVSKGKKVQQFAELHSDPPGSDTRISSDSKGTGNDSLVLLVQLQVVDGVLDLKCVLVI